MRRPAVSIAFFQPFLPCGSVREELEASWFLFALISGSGSRRGPQSRPSKASSSQSLDGRPQPAVSRIFRAKGTNVLKVPFSRDLLYNSLSLIPPTRPASIRTMYGACAPCQLGFSILKRVLLSRTRPPEPPWALRPVPAFAVTRTRRSSEIMLLSF